MHAQLLRLFVTLYQHNVSTARSQAQALSSHIHSWVLTDWTNGHRSVIHSWLDACTAAWLGGCRLRLMQRCWPALVGWYFLCVYTFGGFQLWFLIVCTCLTITSLCNN